MKPKVYLETSVIGYLASRRSHDLIIAANQEITHDWWTERRDGFDLLISQVVVDECRAGDPTAANERLALLDSIPVLGTSIDAEKLAVELLKQVPLPGKAYLDALHIAIATVNGMDYLLTWNCAHIANATLQDRIREICQLGGFRAPVICTPQNLMKD